jgi:hypothetical protein
LRSAKINDNANIKPLRDRLREAFGEQEATSVIERFNASIEGTYSYLIQSRPDLSYMPAKYPASSSNRHSFAPFTSIQLAGVADPSVAPAKLFQSFQLLS